MKVQAECPECGYKVDDASGIGDAAGERPSVGTIALCLRCAGLGVYALNPDGKTLGIRKVTDEEKVELSGNPEVVEAQALIRKMDLMKWLTP